MSNIGKTYEDEQADLFLETKTKIVNNVFELGRILVETKEQLGHGNFTKWIKDSRVNMTPRNCQRYVKVYETFQMRHGMSLLSDLSLNNLYDLAQLPQEDREQMIESSETSKELVKKLKEYKKQQKEEKEKKQEEENIEETQQQEEEKNIGQQIDEVIIEQVDVDFESKYIRVNKIVNTSNKVVETTKTKTSKRLIPLFDNCEDILIKYKNLSKNERIFKLSQAQTTRKFNDIIKRARLRRPVILEIYDALCEKKLISSAEYPRSVSELKKLIEAV